MLNRYLLTLILGGVAALVLSGCGAEADIDAKSNNAGNTLHEAAMNNSLHGGRLLLDGGADIDARGNPINDLPRD